VSDGPLRILLASPAYWPARAFGGPVVAARELVRRLVERGHHVDVLTTTLHDLETPPSRQTSVALVDGARVHALATPVRYRWMGVTPTLPWWLARLPRPDVVHVFGFRDPVTTVTAGWCRARRIPYVFEPLGMLRPRLRKVGLKRVLDATLYRGVASGAAVVAAVSELEAADAVAAGVPTGHVVVRGNGFPDPGAMPRGSATLRPALGIPPDASLVLYVGRIAAGKGIEHLLDAVRANGAAHLVLAGPDDRHGTLGLVRAAQTSPATAGRVHVLPPSPEPPLDLYGAADVFVLASAGDSFGLAAAEAAAAGTPVVVTDRAGVSGFFDEGEALVVPDRREAVVDAVTRVLTDAALRRRLAAGGVAAARRMSWEHVTDVQEQIYRDVASRTAATNASTDGS
jgi:glycosyltransferase involved in cell wall biosynthesis